MPRPRKITDEQVLTITRRLLLERGLRITTRDLATEMGISEGVLFQRFGSKEGLIRLALSIPEINSAQLVAEANIGKDAREALENIAIAIFGAFRRLLPLYIPLLANPQSERERAWTSRASPFQLLLDALEQHLKAERQEGRIRVESAHSTAYFIVSTLHHTALLEAIVGATPYANEGTIRDLIGIIWLGLEPRVKK